ncbi:hypothetical protein ACB092_09G092400, partial [Castanea dentata]
GQCLGDQRSYLLEFKNSLNFDSTLSTKLVRWYQSVDCCSWEGVTCSEGRVVGLYLDNESIYGGLHNSSSLFRLHYLQHLSLAHNDFSPSCIPPEFNPNLATLVQNLTRLTELYLDEVIISSQGNEWCQALSSSLPNLRVLSMSDCNLSGPLDSSLQKLQSLSIINLKYNNFSAPVPEFIADFRNLTSLYLCSCGLNGQFPKKIFQVPTLQTIDLSDNELLQGSLPEFHPNGSLQSLLLSGSNFSGKLHDSIGNLKRLSKIDLSKCNFTGSIPNSLANLTQLVYLDLSSNYFTGPFPSFSMEELDLSSNNLEGPIPMSIFELQGLQNLTLSSNSFNGSLQLNVIQQLRNLNHLDLSNNNLLIEYKLKTFPEFLRHQANLRHLDLSDNQIHGKIPNWFWELPTLYIVNLSCNYLEGPLDNLHSIGFLDLHSNQLKGQLPIPLPFFHYLDLSRNNFNSVLPELDRSWAGHFGTFLSLSSNKFHGQIPKSICKAKSLGVLDLSINSINGTIPDCFYSLSSSLRVLNLRKNNLTGKLSDIFPGDCSLQTLNVNKNLLEGVVPKSLANCRNLEVLDIGNNQIHDVFPFYLKGISELRVLVLQSNKFYGSVDCGGPNVTWPILQIVDLSFNNFSGTLSIKALANSKAMMVDNEAPSELNYLRFEILTIFTSIDLSCNNFEGPIPEEIGVLKSLHILNLSHNAFTGRIPPSLGKLSQLESLDLSSNKLSEEIPMQLANSLTFLSVLNLSFNQLVGPIPYIKQFATFSETSYEGNKGLCGSPLKTTCTSPKPSSLPPTFEDSHSNSRPLIDWNFLSVELGVVFGFGMIIWPIVFCKRWRIRYCKHIDDILFKIFPQLYLGGKQYRGIQAQRNAGRTH